MLFVIKWYTYELRANFLHMKIYHIADNLSIYNICDRFVA